VAEPTATNTTLAHADASPQPSGETLVGSASQPADPNPFVLLGTLLFALAAAAGGAFRGDPSLFRRLTRGLDSSRRPGLHGGDGTLRSLDGDFRQPAPGLTGFDTAGGLSPIVSSPMSAGQPVTGPGVGSQANGGLGGSGGPGSLANGAPSGFDGFAQGAPNGFGADGFSASHLSSADPGVGQHLSGQVGDHGIGRQGFGQAPGHGGSFQASGPGGSVQPDALGQHGSGLSDWHTGGPSGSEAVAQGPSGGSLGGGQGGGGLAHGAGGSGSEFARSGLGGGSADGLGGVYGSDALAHGVGNSGFGGSALGGGHGSLGDGGALAHAPAPSGDFAGAGHVASQPAATPGPDALAQNLTAPDGLPIPDPATLAAPEPPISSASVPGPSWLGIGALARAGAPNPLPRVICCTGCGRALGKPSRFCGYCGEPLDKTLV
jgi:hypothetical protein